MSFALIVLSNTAWQIIGKLTTAGISVVVIKVITNYLDVAGYGIYSQVFEFLSYFAIISDLGLFTIAVREMAKDHDQISFVIGNILTVRCIAAITALTLGVIMAFVIPKYAQTQIALGVAIASIGIFLTILQGTLASVLQVHYRMKIMAVSLVAGKIATLGYILYVVFVKMPSDPKAGFPHLLFASVIGALVMYGITRYYVGKLTHISFRFDFDFWKRVILRSLPYGIALILNNIYFRINSIFIFFIRGEAEAGLYTLSIKILEILASVGLFYMNSILAGLTQALKENVEKARKIIQYSFDFLSFVGMPMIVGITVLAYPIIFLVSKKEYLTKISGGEIIYGSDMALKILVFAVFFQFLIMLFSFLLIALHEQNQLLWINGSGVVFIVIVSYLAVMNYGFIGGSFMSVAAEMLIMSLMYITARKKFIFKLKFKQFYKILISAITMGAVIYYAQIPLGGVLQAKAILLLIPIGIIVYFFMLIITKAITKDMFSELIQKSKFKNQN